jgi:hypothetical protein
MKFVKVTFITDSGEEIETTPQELKLRLLYPGQTTLTIPAEVDGQQGCRPLINFPCGFKL